VTHGHATTLPSYLDRAEVAGARGGSILVAVLLHSRGTYFSGSGGERRNRAFSGYRPLDCSGWALCH
jgi:hypothetical protein